jgi:recombination protein RecR
MHYFSDSVERAIEELVKLPGIGRKSAQRLVFYLLRASKERVYNLSQALRELKDKVIYCSICFNITEAEPCAICANKNRDHDMICVVEEANDILALEKTGSYRGVYHVLGGALSPLDGIGPDELRIKELIKRLTMTTKEIIVATNPNAEGEATALYLSKLVHPLNIKISRIARGLPIGTELEFADEITLSQALEGRVTVDSF